MPLIAYSTEDKAGTNIAKALKADHGFETGELVVQGGVEARTWESGAVKLVEIHTRLSRESEFLSQMQLFSTDLVIFASRHVSATGTPAFTVHATGNWGASTEYGGNPFELAKTSARAIASAYRWLKDNPYENFDVSLEGTHHGPTSLSSPSIFVELGSKETDWHNHEAAAHVANAIMHCAKNYSNEQGRPAIGIGGTHYASKFNALQGRDYFFSHIAPKHVLDGLTPALLKQAIEKTAEKTESIVLDWKGTTAPQRDIIFKAAKECGIEPTRV